MKKVNLSWLLPIVLIIFGAAIFFTTSERAESAAADHLVISQAQISGATAGDEFVELYNPTSSDIDLEGFRLKHETQNGATTSANLVASMSGIIKSHGYFLITSPGYTGSVISDEQYSASSAAITSNNTILIYSDAGITLVDKVGMGSAQDFETSPFPQNPPANGSIQRKVDDTGGQGLDTDNNSTDFESLVVSTPRNSLILVTPTLSLTPTTQPSVSPTEIPTPTVSPTAIPSPSPTEIPTLTPTQIVSPTPTTAPSVTPTDSPTIAPSATVSPAPTTITPAPTGIPVFPRFSVVCTTKIIVFNFGFVKINVPFPVCKLQRV